MGDLLVEEDLGDGIRVLKLNRLPVNALDLNFLRVIEKHFAALENDHGLKALVLTADGKTLSAGMDLKSITTLDVDGQRDMVDAFSKTFIRLYSFPKPLIVAVNGHAIAGGLFIVLAGDYRIGVEGRSQFGLTEVRVGVRFPVGPMEIARAELGPQALRRLLISGQNADVQTARSWGILDELVAPADLMQRAIEIAHDYAAIPPLAFAGVKAQTRAPTVDLVRKAIADESDPLRPNWFTTETLAAANALLEDAKARAN